MTKSEQANLDRIRDNLGGQMLTVAEVAELLRVSNMTVYRLIRKGSLSSLKVGADYRISEAALARYLEEQNQ